MNRLIPAIIFLLATFVHGSDTPSASSVQGRFDRARLAFENGDWPTSITTYKTLLGDGINTWSLNFNLGTSYFKNNEPGPAIFYLERARILAPSNEEVKLQLAKVREEFSVPNYSLRTWERWARWFTPNFWIGFLCISGWVALIAILLPQIRNSSAFNSTPFHFTRIFSILFVAVGIAGFLVTKNWYSEGIITADEVTLKLAPTKHSPELRAILPGEKARIFKTEREHAYILAADGSKGWVSLEEIDKLWH
ncbi:MAG: tetratricopeptide repeat protein [Opitutales bacterium]